MSLTEGFKTTELWIGLVAVSTLILSAPVEYAMPLAVVSAGFSISRGLRKMGKG